MASVGAAADVSSPGPFGAAAVVASVAGAAVVAASVAAAVVDAAVVSLCVPFVSEPPVDTAAADVPVRTVSRYDLNIGIPSTAAADVDSTAVVSSGETFTVPVFLRITAACPL